MSHLVWVCVYFALDKFYVWKQQQQKLSPNHEKKIISKICLTDFEFCQQKKNTFQMSTKEAIFLYMLCQWYVYVKRNNDSTRKKNIWILLAFRMNRARWQKLAPYPSTKSTEKMNTHQIFSLSLKFRCVVRLCFTKITCVGKKFTGWN